MKPLLQDMKLLMEAWRVAGSRFSESVRFIRKDFDSVVEEGDNKEVLVNLLQELGWPEEMIQYHEHDGTTPFAEVRDVILDIDHYQVPAEAKLINAMELYDDPEHIAAREKEYQEYIAGEVNKYFKDDPSDPKKINFQELSPVTAQETDSGLKVIDGSHRTFLAQKANEKLNVWVVKPGTNTNLVVKKIKELFHETLC